MKHFALLAFLPLLLAAGDPATEAHHVVAEGETLSGIASRAGVPMGVIAAANGLVEPYNVRVGQTLAIPRQRVHVVKDGDTGLAISRRYGVPFENIAIANGMDEPYTVKTGQRLIIPAVIAVSETPVETRTEPYFRWPHDGAVLLGFQRRDDKGHEGIDLAAKTGDMVRASSSGTVVYAQQDSGRFGRLIVLDHGNGWRTRYGHLSRITVKLGDVVKTGERLGLAGSGGVATRPEVHFDILKDNVPVDPAKKLPQR
uniref:M23 family metallopeptidase n=1 Tax=Parerythrobacter lutipelagi TaxID=1964208 RepID=UPI001375EF16|nr:M23 family metallopeptidase [Parerythrobacter lutipelagi]